MSKFLDAKIGVRIPAGQARTVTRDQFKTWLEAAGWRTIHTEDTTPSLTVIPPATEDIGNARGKEAVRLNFTTTAIEVRPVYQTNEACKRSYFFSANTYNTPISIKIGAQTITGATAGTQSGATANLLSALQASATAEALAYSYASVPLGSTPYIIATENVPGGGPDITNSNGVSVFQRTAKAAVNEVFDRAPYLLNNAFKATVDIGQGYALYFGIFARSLVLATRTLAGFYGPVAASYFSRASALAQCPDGGALSELALANLAAPTGGNTNSRYAVRFGLVYGYGTCLIGTNSYNNNYAVRLLENHLPETPSAPYPTALVARDNTMEPSALGYPGGLDQEGGGNLNNAALFGAGGITSGALMVPTAVARNASGQTGYITSVWTPAAALEDAVTFLVSDSSENEYAIRTGTFSPLTGALDASSTSFGVTDASALPASGTLVVDAEVMTYASKSGNTLQGVTRAVNGTAAAPHAANTPVYLGFWWLKINQGAVPTGYLPVGS